MSEHTPDLSVLWQRYQLTTRQAPDELAPRPLLLASTRTASEIPG